MFVVHLPEQRMSRNIAKKTDLVSTPHQAVKVLFPLHILESIFLNVYLKIRFPLSKFSSHNYYLSLSILTNCRLGW